LAVRLDQRIEGIEKLLLDAVFVRKKLNVIDEEQVQRVVVAL